MAPAEVDVEKPTAMSDGSTSAGGAKGGGGSPKKGEDAAATRKRTAVDAPPGAEEGEKAPAMKRRRAGTSSNGTAPPKKSVRAKVATAKKAPVKAKKAAKAVSESESESESDSESASSSESGMGEAPPPTDTAKPKPVAVPVPKKPASAVVAKAVAIESLDSVGVGAPKRAQTPVADMLKQAKRRLTDVAIDEIVPLILRNERPAETVGEDDGRVLVISSLNLQVVLRRAAHGSDEVTKENAHKLLGVTREQVDNAEAVAIVLHGPHTEAEARARLKYEDEAAVNYHWSLACWFRSVKDEVFHYDSHHPLNDRRCAEVLGVLRMLGVLPTDVRSYVLPDFFPQQEEEWECGYEALIALTILSSSPRPSPITEADVDTSYRPFFTTLTADGGRSSLFIKRLRELVAREKYAF